jgi:hypothetical protein
MADWEDIVLGGALGTIGGFFLTKKKAGGDIPLLEDALIRHKARVEAKIASQTQQEPGSTSSGVSGKGVETS